MSPRNCPKNELGIAECLICSYNRDGYCWALCPPEKCKKPINDILTLEERISIIEAQISNIRYLEDVEDMTERLISLESLASKLEIDYKEISRITQSLNTLQETVNLTLSKFSKRLISLEEKIYGVIQTKQSSKKDVL